MVPLSVLSLVQRVAEHLAGDFQDGLAEHLQQPPVGVPGEPFVAALLGQPLDAGVVESDVQDGLHHAGHRELGAGPDADQQRVVPIAQPAAEPVFQVPQRHGDLDPQVGRFGALLEVFPAGVGGDGEPGRHRQTQPGHLGQVRALAAEQVLLVLVSFGEFVNVLGHRRSPSGRRGGRG